MFVKYGKKTQKLIIQVFVFCSNVYAVSDAALVFVDKECIYASQVGAPSIYMSFAPASIENLIDYYALLAKAEKLSFINPSQIKIDTYKKNLIEKLGLEGKGCDQIDAELKRVLQTDQIGLTKSIVDFFKVYSLIETFVNAKVSSVHKGEIEEYCNKNPKYAHPSFTVLVSENMCREKYKEIKVKSKNSDELEKALGLYNSMEITLNALDIDKDLCATLESTEISALSDAVESKKSTGDVFVVKMLSKNPKRLLNCNERHDEVCSIIMSKNREYLYEQVLAEARKECAIQFNIPKDKI